MIATGNKGSIIIDGDPFCALTNWTITINQETVDTTPLNSSYREFGKSLVTGGGSLDSLEHIDGITFPSTKLPASFITGGGNTISGTIIITDYSPTVGVNDTITYSYSFRFTSTITIS